MKKVGMFEIIRTLLRIFNHCRGGGEETVLIETCHENEKHCKSEWICSQAAKAGR